MESTEKLFARYEQIALMIATDINRGIYTEGDKIFGRSVLAGKYGVSPETIRKALSILQEKGITSTFPGSGVYILSRQAARSFIDNFQQHSHLENLLQRLTSLTKHRNKLNQEIDKIIHEIVNFKRDILQNIQKIEDIPLSSQSLLIGKSVHEAQLRTITGVTVIAVRRKGRWYASPGKDLRLAEGDILQVAGHKKALELFRHLVEGDQVSF